MQLGEYIIFIDADDYLEPNMLGELYNKAKINDSDIVICDYYEVYSTKKQIIKAMEILSDNSKINYMLSNPSPWNKLVRTNIIKEKNIKFLENYIYEDLATLPILAGYANNITYVEEPLYNYIIREGSTMRQQSYNKKLESIFVAIDHLENEFKKRGLYYKYKNELEYIYIEHLLYASSRTFFILRRRKRKIKKNSRNSKTKISKLETE